MLYYVHFYIPGTDDKGVVEVTNSFGVPHKEYEDTVSKLIIDILITYVNYIYFTYNILWIFR